MYIRNKKIRKKRKPSSYLAIFFYSGILTGILLCAAVAAAILYKNTEGINIYLSGAKIFNVISNEVERQVQAKFPGFISEIRSEVPALVENYMQEDFITIGNLEIGGYLVRLPDELIRQLEDDLRNDVIYYVYELLDELEDEQFISELCESITKDVLNSLLLDLDGQVFTIPITNNYSIPVVIWLN